MYGTFTLTGRHTTPSGKAHAGQVVITPNTTIRDIDGDVVMSGAERVALDQTGAWSIVLPCDSPGLNPSEGIGYRIGYALHSVSELPQSFYATADLAGSTLDVSDIVTVSVPAPLSAIVGPQGEPGPAGSPVDSAAFVDSHVGPTLSAPASGDSTDTLNAFLAAASPAGVKRLIGSFSVAGTIAVPAGAYVDLSAATITQTASSTATLDLAAGATILGGKIVGKGADYVAGVTGLPAAVGVRVAANDVTVIGTTLTNHAGAGIFVSACSGFRASNVKVVGLGSPTIPANDSSQFGIYVNAGCTDLTFSQVDVSKVSIGFISSYDTTHLTVNGIRAHDIPGQHGVYIQNGNGLNLANADVWNCNMNGVKLQINATATTDMLGTAVTNVTATSCADTGLTVNNVDAALTRKWRGVTISNVTAISCGRGLYLGSLRGAVISAVTVYNSNLDAITFVDSQNVAMNGAVVDTSGRAAIRFTGVANGSNDGITVSTLRTNNPGQNNTAGNLSGIYVNQCANLQLNQWRANSSNGFTDYSLFFASATAAEQQGLTLRNCDLAGAVSGYEIRLMAGPVAVREFDNIKLAANQVLNYPTALVTRVGSVGINTIYASNAIPASGGIRGDICWNNTPAASGAPGWVCVAAGTWKTMPAIGA